MKHFWKFAVAALSAFAVMGCAGSSDDHDARIRFVHASPDAPNVDIFVNDRAEFTNVPYFASGEIFRREGRANVQINATGTSTTVIDADLDFLEGRFYTILAADRLASIAPIVVNDPDEGPGSGNTRVRLVHASPSAGTVDIYVTAPDAPLPGTPTLASVPFKAVSDALTVPSGQYRVRITPAGNPGVIAIDTGALTFPSNSALVAVALDAAGGGEDALTARVYGREY
jgi:hypothetical protein